MGGQDDPVRPCLPAKNPKVQSLRQFAANLAFPGWTAKELLKLFNFWEVPYERGKKPKGEVPLLVALMRFCLPELTDQEIRERIAMKGKPVDPELIEKECIIFKSGGTWEELLEEEESDEELQKELEEFR